MTVGRLLVGPETVRMLELGHPWVIADRYTRKWPPVQKGEVAHLVDEKGCFLASALLDPGDRVVARVLAHEPLQLDRPWLERKLAQASALRTAHADLAECNAYRLVNGEGDGLPGLTVDRYDSHLMVQLYTEAWKPHLPLVAGALQHLLSPVGIYVKSRPQQTRKAAGGSGHSNRLIAGAAVGGWLQVRENGLNFRVDLEQGLHTGLFLDQRRNRREFMGRCRGRRVLNLFAFTGAFSVAAAAAGAERVTSVDVSAPYLEWAKENFGLNRLNPKRHDFIVGDCLVVLQELRRRGTAFDIILMDPPSFSTTRKGRFTTRQGTSDLVASALPLLSPGGLLVTSSNHQKVDIPEYLKELRRGARQAECDLRVIGLHGQPEDFPYPVTFPEGRYLKYVIGVKG